MKKTNREMGGINNNGVGLLLEPWAGRGARAASPGSSVQQDLGAGRDLGNEQTSGH